MASLHTTPIPHGDALTLTTGYIPDLGEDDTCGACGKELEVSFDHDDNDRPVVSFKNDITSHNGVTCCSDGCATVDDIDLRKDLAIIESYILHLETALDRPQHKVMRGGRVMPLVELLRKMNERHTDALERDGVVDAIRECE